MCFLLSSSFFFSRFFSHIVFSSHQNTGLLGRERLPCATHHKVAHKGHNPWEGIRGKDEKERLDKRRATKAPRKDVRLYSLLYVIHNTVFNQHFPSSIFFPPFRRHLLTAHTTLQASWQSQFAQLGLQGMREFWQRALAQHHRLRGDKARACKVRFPERSKESMAVDWVKGKKRAKERENVCVSERSEKESERKREPEKERRACLVHHYIICGCDDCNGNNKRI